jgi:hypothetical protein
MSFNRGAFNGSPEKEPAGNGSGGSVPGESLAEAFKRQLVQKENERKEQESAVEILSPQAETVLRVFNGAVVKNGGGNHDNGSYTNGEVRNGDQSF